MYLLLHAIFKFCTTKRLFKFFFILFVVTAFIQGVPEVAHDADFYENFFQT